MNKTMRKTVRNVIRQTVVLSCILFGLLWAGGCSRLQARGEMAQAIVANADLAAARAVSSRPASESAQILAANAETFAAYKAAATVNVWSYLFGGRQILVTASIYGDVCTFSALADEWAARANRGELSEACIGEYVTLEAERLMMIRQLKEATK